MRFSTLRAIFCVSTCCFLQRGVIAEPLGPAVDLIKQAVANHDIPGASVLVMQNGQPLLARAFGVCDRNHHRAFQSDTICWIASLTKPVTAAAAMTLVEQGKLDLNTSIEVYLPEFRHQTAKDGKHYSVTVRQLMCHASGIQSSVPLRPRYFFQQSWYDRSLSEIVPAIARTKLIFRPGTDVQYSNAAPYVLGRIIEKLSGEPFGEYVNRKILKPLNMSDTGFSISPRAADRTAIVYRREKDTTVEFFRHDERRHVTMTMPDGGLFSTTSDMLKFANAFLNDGTPILSKASVDEMLSPQSTGYGLGWILDQPNQFSHWGSSGTMMWGDRSTKAVGAVFMQVQDRKLVANLHHRFRQIVTRSLPKP